MALVIALFLAGVAIPLGALSVDIGFQRVARSDAQSVADTVALDMARDVAHGDSGMVQVSGGSNQTAGDASVTTAAVADAARETGLAANGNQTVRAYQGYVDSTKAWSSYSQDLGCSSAGLTSSAGYFTYPVPSGKTANAVLVVVSTSVPFALAEALPGGGPNRGYVCRSSIATTISNSACYDVGSYAAAVDSGNSALLNPLLQQIAGQSGFSNSADVKAISYSGLATSQIDLNQLAANLGMGSVSQLASTTVKLKSLYLAMANAMVSPANSTNLTALNTLAAEASGTATVDMGKLLQVDSGSSSLTSARMNALDLVGGTLELLNGANVASVNVASTLPGIANANAQITLIQMAHHFCGIPGDSAVTNTDSSYTSQLSAKVTATLAPATVTLSSADLTVPGVFTTSTSASVAAPNNATVSLQVAPTRSTLNAITCSTNTSSTQGADISVINGLATATITTSLPTVSFTTSLSSATIPSPVGGTLLGANVATKVTIQYLPLTISATLMSNGTVDVSILVPPRSFDTPYNAGTSGSIGDSAISATGSDGSISAQTTAGLTLLGVSLGVGTTVNLTAAQTTSLVSAATNAVAYSLLDTSNPNSLASGLLNPLLGLVGATVGGSDVVLDSTPALTCGNPTTVG